MQNNIFVYSYVTTDYTSHRMLAVVFSQAKKAIVEKSSRKS